jgi:hypothetical protein
VYCLKVPFLRTVKYNNFVPYDIFLYNCDHKIGSVTLKKKIFCSEKEECGPEKDLLWKRGGKVLLLLPWCSKYFCNKQE